MKMKSLRSGMGTVYGVNVPNVGVEFDADADAAKYLESIGVAEQAATRGSGAKAEQAVAGDDGERAVVKKAAKKRPAKRKG